MAAVATPAEPDGPAPFAQSLTCFERSVDALKASARLAQLTDDPSAGSLTAMVRVMDSLAAQFAVREAERQELARSLQLQADRIADEALARVQASGATILETLAPELSRLVQRTVHQRLWTIKLRTLLAAASAGVGLAVVTFAVSYGAGYAAGRQNGLLAAKTIVAALTAEPQAAAAWSRIMTANDPAAALAACHKHTARNAQGRRYCVLPIWLDPARLPQR
ncbi:MAG: hypothetical protein KGL26_14300 [Pseudomonadota bacterium]|nr:hypothetical protein [Pseudomonadota bacterium]